MSEWVNLISQAKQQGISKEELMQWFEDVKKAAHGNVLPKEKQIIS